MTSIPIEALKGKTIGEIRELIKQAESLPENQSPKVFIERAAKLDKKGMKAICGTDEEYGTYVDDIIKPQTAQELLEEIENGE